MSNATDDATRDTTGWLSVAEAATALGITAGAVRKRVERGQLAGERGPGGRVRVRLTPAPVTTGRHDTTVVSDALVASLQADVDYLRAELTRAHERLDEQQRRHDTIVATPAAAPAPTPTRPWWRPWWRQPVEPTLPE